MINDMHEVRKRSSFRNNRLFTLCTMSMEDNEGAKVTSWRSRGNKKNPQRVYYYCRCGRRLSAGSRNRKRPQCGMCQRRGL